jgi:hypothetical protein
MDSTDGSGDPDWSDWNTNASNDVDSYQSGYTSTTTLNVTWGTPMNNITAEQASVLVANATSEWLSFFMMTIGWFILLTSVLGFWRVKRWERGVLASQRGSDAPSSSRGRQVTPVASTLESNFGLRGASIHELFRQGFGLSNPRSQANNEEQAATTTVIRAEEGHVEIDEGEAERAQEIDRLYAPALDSSHPRHHVVVRTLQSEVRLHRDLRDAGLI